MEKLKQLLAELKDIDVKLDELLANDELTDEQRAEHDDLVASRTKCLAAIDRENARIKREDQRKAAETQVSQLKSDREAAARIKQQLTTRPGRLTDPDITPPGDVPSERRRSTVPATAKRFGSLKNFQGEFKGRDAEERAYRFGMFGLSMLSESLPWRYRNPQAEEWFQRELAAVTSKDATGTQYLIPEEFSRDLIDLKEQYGVVRRLFRPEPMTSDTKVFSRRQGGLTAYFVNEGATGTESNKVWDRVRLTAKDLMVLSRYTSQVNADTVISFGDDLAGEISYAFANKEDECGFNGDGTSTYGGILGVRTKLTSIDLAGTDSAGLVVSANTTWGAILLTELQSVVGLLPAFSDTPNTAWVMHRTFYYTVIERLVMAVGGVTAMEVRSGERRPRPIFLGYPVEFSQVWPNATATDSVVCALGDFRLGCAFGDRQQDAIAFSEHATIGGENVFERNEIAIRGTERMDINVHDIGTTTLVGPVVGLRTKA